MGAGRVAHGRERRQVGGEVVVPRGSRREVLQRAGRGVATLRLGAGGAPAAGDPVGRDVRGVLVQLRVGEEVLPAR